jgi:hypothetical protein
MISLVGGGLLSIPKPHIGTARFPGKITNWLGDSVSHFQMDFAVVTLIGQTFLNTAYTHHTKLT